ncbi:cysteine-rich CWC family protein [Rhodopseudomonas sp. B29]|uniref:cysteine-rich CWC family protein n=1 Tax=Rhodopseudomonas sp. B29 TaxID=95607 RepID=UPI000345E25E|nr:cysteine-rich CWC family protein [Rhodopseudomonas sp. B29]
MPLRPAPSTTPPPAPRRLICAGCGAEFGCTMDGDCWCAAEPVKMPMPSDAADCLCPDCLREAAKASRAS